MTVGKLNLGDGKSAWQVSLMVDKKRERRRFRTRQDAGEYELEMKTRIRAGTYPRATMTLRDLLPDFMSHLRHRQSYGEIGERHIRRRFGQICNYVVGGRPISRGPEIFNNGVADVSLASFSKETVQTFADEVLRFGRTAKATSEIVQALSLFLEFALRMAYIEANYARGFKVGQRKYQQIRG